MITCYPHEILFIHICFLFTTILKNQKTEKQIFNFEGEEIEYTRIDYSKHGMGNFFVTMVTDEAKNSLTEKNATKCLNRISRLYHSLYFFVKVPKRIKGLEKRQQIFSKFVQKVKSEEQYTDFFLYLNFDIDYSKNYQNLLGNEISKKEIKRIYTDVNQNNICKCLGVN